MIGEQIENYRILSRLGGGAMGVVYKAMDLNLDRVVALKLMNAGLSHHPELEARFRSEARTQATLNHHNIATLYSFLTWEGKAVMVMEYVDGKTLQQMISERGALPPVTALALCKQALYGVGAAHRQGIVHRDLKPANLMLSNDGVVKVMDFGIAKIKGGGGLKGTAMAIGTYDYMAPEQALNKQVDGRTDIYSMGITLYEMLTGDVPFQCDSELAVQMAHLNERPRNPMERNAAIPAEVADVVLRALEKKPEDRFATTEDFIRALPRLSDAPVQAPPASFPSRGTVIETGGFSAATSPGVAPPPPSRPAVPATEIHAAPAQLEAVAPPSVRHDPPAARQGPLPPGGAEAQKSARDVERHAANLSQGPKKGNTGVLLGAAIAAAIAVALGGGWILSKPKPTATVAQNSATTDAKPPVTGNPNGTAPAPKQDAKLVPPPGLPGKKPDTGTDANRNNDAVPRVVPGPPNNGKADDHGTDHGNEVQPPPSAAGLVGAWTGSYLDSTTQETTMVNFTFRGTEDNLTGTATFTLADSTAGECSVSGSKYDASRHMLTLLYTSCKGSKVPAYLHSPTIFGNVDSEAKTLKSGRVMYMPTVNAAFAKHGF